VIRLIGLKSLHSTALDFFGIRARKVGINAPFERAMSMEIVKDLHHIFLDNIPARLEESQRESIRAWGLVPSHALNNPRNFLFNEWQIKSSVI
jgi:hypothetical protein